jgi:ABC-type uncharacterized transport system auxiliary subunit
VNFETPQALKLYSPLTALLLALLLTPLFLSGCALALSYPLTSASLGVWGATGKSPSDHAMSYVTDQDCESLRLLNSENICQKVNTKPVEVVDKSTRYKD